MYGLRHDAHARQDLGCRGQAGRGYATRLTSSGRTDLSFRSHGTVHGRRHRLRAVAFALPRPNGGAFVISQNQSRVGANLAWFVQALDSRGRIQSSWGYRGFTWGGPLRCRQSVSCGALLVGGQVLADGRLRLVGSFDDIDDSKADPRTPSSSGSQARASGTPRSAQRAGPVWQQVRSPALGLRCRRLRRTRPDLLPGRPDSGAFL